ncbi:hypothetical protein [Terrisporobacter mayombei]|uniref:Uncharacterized protein n=1 Tax=Terrisporobacter mayombei TaxID=1541 RepID=A0ABY9Q4G8_9FIRM|nr:hypothetical protein [Terrisporobacter mayombei]MCC3869079.1 hypothetical protein [Terrisporobacter mayombei]WMT82787.1 hypothetical protein TEMA_32790 [Terrisporobacter mayombei]
MSLFLGKIHYWLFNKILWFEKLENEIINLAKEEGFEVEKLSAEIQNKYGEKLPNKPLEELIDTSNIHGWLQNQIHCAERRMAAWTKLLIEADEKNYSKLEEVYKSQGIVAANEIKSEGKLPSTPEELFNCINDYILDGMPCDRVNEVILKDEDKIEWVQRICVHKDIWKEVGCKVDYFYDLRNAWIKYFVNELNNDYEYDLQDGNTKTIKRR